MKGGGKLGEGRTGRPPAWSRRREGTEDERRTGWEESRRGKKEDGNKEEERPAN